MIETIEALGILITLKLGDKAKVAYYGPEPQLLPMHRKHYAELIQPAHNDTLAAMWEGQFYITESLLRDQVMNHNASLMKDAPKIDVNISQG